MKPLPWSFSALTDYINCPKAFFEKRVAKSVVELPNEAGQWGNYVHEEFDKYLKEWTPFNTPEDQPLPGNLEQYREYLDRIAAGPGRMLSECKYAINARLEPCDFFDPKVWCRSIIDVLHLDGNKARVLDHKTGKMKPGSRQLMLSALMVFLHHPEVEEVKTGFFWLKEQRLTHETYTREDEAGMWEEFIADLTSYKQAFKLELFPPRPSGLCNGWCPVTTCEFWKPKRNTAGR